MYKLNRMLSIYGVLCACVLVVGQAQAALLLNGDFEDLDTSMWQRTPTASIGGPAILGSASGQLTSEFLNIGDYAVLFQTVALDGSDFSPGDLIQLKVLAQFLDRQNTYARSFIELAFRNGNSGVWGGITDVDFSSAVRVELTESITLQELLTSVVEIPEFITSDAFGLSATTGIRIALAMGPILQTGELTRVAFDNVELTRVPEPSVLMMLLVGFIGMLRRKQTR
ncbi:PEP-CTERM sorting domain-containing protein [Aestuariibacter salexigens]|uniref:PEP-CTERM sorting domain-containing protein n=1 Tax=Aestuariibacter salexigens TaxID=226010 RepID=UPI00146F9F55|nr:PEP-CTERM sorting domain-containing protein [Aestuariibacter salexigens]